MKYIFYFVFVSCIVLVSCENDDPKPENDTLSRVFGDYIYTVIQGNGQTGAKGQYLGKEIKIVVRDFEGRFATRRFSFSLSDTTGFLYHYYPYSDTLTVAWMLGCSDANQTLTITDSNVCGLKKNECVEVDVFELKATATSEPTKGWYKTCMPENISNQTRAMVSDKLVTLVVGNQLISSTDILSGDWKRVTLPYSLSYFSYDMLGSGELLIKYNSRLYLLSSDGSEYKELPRPVLPYYYGYMDLEVASSGAYFFVHEGSRKVYRSTDGTNWVEYLDVWEASHQESYYVQGIAEDNNKIYLILKGYHQIVIDTKSDKYEHTRLKGATWSNYADLGQYHIEVINDRIFMHDEYNKHLTHVINSSSGAVNSYNHGFNSRLVKSDGKIYVVSQNREVTVKEWIGTEFSKKSYDYPKTHSFYRPSGSMYKGAPIIIANNRNKSQIYYYIK